MNKKNGISLIVLIITIIVLVIITGAVINNVVQKRMIDEATGAVEDAKIAQEIETIQIAYYTVKTGKIGSDALTDITAEELNEELGEKATASGENPITVSFPTGRSYEVTLKGVVTQIGGTVLSELNRYFAVGPEVFWGGNSYVDVPGVNIIAADIMDLAFAEMCNVITYHDHYYEVSYTPSPWHSNVTEITEEQYLRNWTK